MLAEVAKATVVITNPTHYAVALAYDRARQAAPKLVAKGVAVMPARIRDVAAKNWVPMGRTRRSRGPCTGWNLIAKSRPNISRRWPRSSPMSGA